MFEWLNHNAAGVQALASICSVIATVVLLRTTRQYVALTQEIARAAREQLRFQRRALESEAAQLTTLIDVFLGSLKRLPVTEAERDTIRTVALWKGADVSTFGSLAATALGSAPEVQGAIQRLNWIRSNVDRVQQTGPDAEFPWDQFPWAEWARQIDEARAALQTVRADALSSPPAEPSASEPSETEAVGK